MAKLKTNPIIQADLIEFLDKCSDFAFEINVIKVLTSLNFECEHAGTYLDPVTQKPRQFDIRATRRFDQCIVRLAVECKNLQPNFPMLISCLPRTIDESFHDVVVSVNPDQVSLLPESVKTPIYNRAMEPYAKTVRLRDVESLYKQGQFVGKSLDQIGRDSKNGIVANDSEVFGRSAQAIASAHDLVDRACYDGERGENPLCFSFVLPILVVPNGTLWITHFDHDGNRILEPESIDRCQFFIDKSYYAGDKLQGTEYRVSHLEFVTISGLQKLIAQLSSNELQDVFPRNTIIQRITDYLSSGENAYGAI